MSPLTKVPPPLALAFVVGAAVLLTRFVPGLQAFWFRSPGGASVVALGTGVWSLWGWIEFWRFRTTILPMRKPTRLLCTGPFRFSRNPLYLAMLTFAATPWLYSGQIGLLLAPVGFFAFVNVAVIPYEEAKLRSLFGDAYADYVRRVRRWL